MNRLGGPVCRYCNPQMPPYLRNGLLSLVAALLLWGTGCLSLPLSGVTLRQTEFPPLQKTCERPSPLLHRTVEYTLSAMASIDPEEAVTLGGHALTVRDLLDTLAVFQTDLDTAQDDRGWTQRLRKDFDLYEIPEEVLFTGYYEPLLPGSLTPTKRFCYPLYRRPAERRKKTFGINGTVPSEKIPYYTREEIDSRHVLKGRGLELVWLDDPVERFFLHVQGAGSIRLPDGRRLRVQYDGSNDRPYRSIGRLLIQQGKLAPGDASLQGIKAYLGRHPEEREKIMNADERYVFFQTDEGGARGVLDIPLTPYHSLATDPRVLPTGSLLYYVTRFPELDSSGAVSGWRTEAHFAVSQDIGEAISGPLRVDVYFGAGEEAAARAGRMMAPGRIYVLIRKRGRTIQRP